MKVNAPLKLTLLSLSLLQCMSAIASDTEVNKEDKLPSVTLAPIVVTAENISSHKLLGGAQSTLSKDIESLNSNLKSQRAVSLGQTVEKISGVQNNSFGANNGIPQIRSLTNSRVRINNNGMGVAGLATISGNLPTAINPALADSIDVYKSSASVLYGGNAIGGVVNVNTSQIPTSLPDSSIKGEVEVSGGNNVTSDQSFQLTGKLGQFAWYLDAMNSHVDDYDIPGNAKADACYDINNIWRMGKNGMGENTSLARACQMKVVTEQKFNPKYYQLINKEFLTALNAGEDAVQAYKDKYGLGTVKGEYKDASKINWKSPMYLRVWKNKNQFKSLPAEQQKIILEEKWGGYVIPNYNKLSLNPVYEAGQSENLEVLKTFEDMVATEKGKMTNSHMDNKTVSTGLSYIGKNGYAGIGMSYYKNDYGVPGYASLTTKTNVTTINKQPVNIESKQKKLSFESGYSPSITGIDNISAKVNYIDAINEEYLGSTFANQLNAKQVEARVELNHYWNDVASGSIGIDSTRRKTDGSGQDRFLPDTKSRQYGIFALQQLNGEGWQAKAGYRNEKVKHQSFFDDGYTSSQGGNANQGKYSENVRDFNLHNYFIDMNWQPIDFLSLTARYSRSQRAPEVNELFASNFHFATLTDEQGSPSLNKETAKTLELGGQVNWESGKFSVNHFNTDYDDYIYLANTGISRESLEVKEWRQADTVIKGWELELNQLVDLQKYGNLDIRLFSDLVKNYPADKDSMRYRRDGHYMPNMPTSRYGMGLSWNKDKWTLGTSLTHYATQKYGTDTGWEVDLPDYNLVDGYVGYKFQPSKYGKAEWFLDGRNLTNADAHPNNSTLKYLTPIAGRSFRTGIRLSF